MREGRKLTGVGVAREVAGPLDEGAVLEVARGDGEEADGADDAGVGQLGLGGDDGVGDVVVDGLRGECQLGASREGERLSTHAVLLLLDLEDGAVLEGPPDDVGLLLGVDGLAALEGGPELLEVTDCFAVSSRNRREREGGR